MSFFGKGTGFDPFDFLDGAPVIKPPLDLGDTDSDEEASETASSVSLGSVSTTASPILRLFPPHLLKHLL